MLWIGERLSTLERLSIASFLANGHPVHLYTYGPVEGVPKGTEIHNAATIVDRALIFRNPPGFGQGSYAGFANLFRYKLLYDRGGIWCDADVVCLKHFDFLARGPILVATEHLPPEQGRDPDATQMNACFLAAPPGVEAMRELYETCVLADKAAFRWGDLGPRLVTRVFMARGLVGSAIPPSVICPIDFWRIEVVVQQPFEPPPICHALHLYNEMWRQKGLAKDGTHAPQSAYEELKRRYLPGTL